jgi:hypothetical protein
VPLSVNRDQGQCNLGLEGAQQGIVAAEPGS